MNNNQTNDLLKEILKWQKLQGSEYLKRKAKEEKLFTDKKHILVYYYSDGHKSSREIGKIASVSHVTVQNLWKLWIDAGIAEPSEKYKGGQCRKLFELNELGLELPKIKNKENQI
jgi:transposase